jgi:recombination protein RecR
MKPRAPGRSDTRSSVGRGLPPSLGLVAQLFARLPGVGEKTGLRYALHVATGDPDSARALARELLTLAERVRPCVRCNHVAELREDEDEARCELCLDPRRDDTLLCVVGRVQELLAIERSGAMRGRYFVLGKLLSPLDGVGRDDLPLAQLFDRVEEGAVREVIVATPPSVDGEATALLLSRELSARGAKVTRLASGVPHGGDLEFADQVTLGRAIEGRRALP